MTVGSHTAQLFCNTIFGLCPFPSVTAYDVTFPSAKPATSRPAVSGKTPVTLEESMYAAIQEIAPNAAFTLFTGDVVEGAVWLVNETEVTNDLKNAYTKMTALGQVYATVG